MLHINIWMKSARTYYQRNLPSFKKAPKFNSLKVSFVKLIVDNIIESVALMCIPRSHLVKELWSLL